MRVRSLLRSRLKATVSALATGVVAASMGAPAASATPAPTSALAALGLNRVVMPRGTVGQYFGKGNIGGSYLTTSTRSLTSFIAAPAGNYIVAVFWNGIVNGSSSEQVCSTGRLEGCGLEIGASCLKGRYYNATTQAWDLLSYTPAAGETYYARFDIREHATLTQWPASGYAYIRTDCVSQALGDSYPGWLGPAGSSDTLFRNATALTAPTPGAEITNGQAHSPGAMTTANGYVNSAGSGYAMLPVMMIGSWGAAKVASLGIFGTSIEAGAGDTGDIGNNAAGGWAQRAMRQTSGAVKYTYINLASPSSRTIGLTTDKANATAGNPTSRTTDGAYTGPFRLWAMRYIDGLVCGGPINDVGAGAETASATLGYQTQLYADARAAGVRKIAQATITISAGSTDNFATKANQLIGTAFAAGGAKDTVNSTLQGQVGTATGPDYWIDTLTPSADGSDNHYWLTNGTAGYATDTGGRSGIHPTAVIAAAQAVSASPVVDSLYAGLTA